MTMQATVAAYLAALAPDRRARLEALRSVILAEAPAAEELLSYGMPSYKLGGRYLASIGAFTHHDSLFPASRAVIEALGDEVTPYVRGRGTYRFAHPAPLPLELVARIVRARLEEIGSR